MNNIVIKNIEPQSIKISGAGEVIGITAVYVNGVNVTEGSVAYVIVPTKTSELVNNSGFITEETDPTIPYYIKQIRLADITRWNNKQDELVSGVNIKTINSNSLLGSGNIDISTSYTAGTGIEITEENVINNTITSYDDLTDLPTIPTKISDLTNDSDFVESTSLAEVAFNGSYLSLSNTPEIPTNTSELTNDGEDGIHPYITNETDSLVNYYDKDFLYNLLPKVSDTDTIINLSPTYSSKLEMILSPTELSQDGTPTPSSSEDIHVITDENIITVCGKNLFDGNVEQGAIASNTGQSYEQCKTANNTRIRTVNLIPLDTTKSYTISITTGYNYVIQGFNSSGKLYDIGQATWKSASSTITNVPYIALAFKKTSEADITPSEISNIKVMLEVGSTATSYSSYTSTSYTVDLGSIEYCKIGTYEDRIFKNVSGDPDYSNERDEGAWYLKKNIGKVILDGSESWALGSPTNRYYYAISSQAITSVASISNYFVGFTSAPVDTDNAIYLQNTDSTTLRINLYNTSYVNDLDGFKSWLSTHNTIVYYVLTTPTYTKITDTDLVGQLEAIYNNATSYTEQTNILQTPYDLPFTITATTLKDISNL